MRRLITTSATVKAMVQLPTFHSYKANYGFSTISSAAIQKALEYQFNLRTIIKFSDLHQYVMNEAQGIKKYGKTVLLEFLNEYPMQSFKRARDQSNQQLRQAKRRIRNQLYLFLNDLQGLNFYEKNMRYSIFKKMIAYNGTDTVIMEKCSQYEVELLELIKNEDLHFLDIINWLYMLPIDYTSHFSKVAFDRLDKFFQNRQICQYLKAQRALPMLIKRICELDWNDLRKYKNIIHFLVFEACHRSNESVEEISTTLQRLCAMKLHTIGERVIPKIIDQIMERLNKDFDSLTQNKMLLLKVFGCFNSMPISYNRQFFERLHNYIKSINELPSHVLLYLPYSKLSQSEVTYIQTKIFTSGREDTAPKLIYSVYKPFYRHVFTPLIIKEGYLNMLDIWKKDKMKNSIYFQIYNALIFRFIKINHPIIDLKKLKTVAQSLAENIEADNYDALQVFSFAGLAAFLEICHFFDLKLNYHRALGKIQYLFMSRKSKNSLITFSQNLIETVHVHCNCIGHRTHQFLTKMIHQLVTNPEVQSKFKNQLLFLIEKNPKIDPKWSSYSNDIFQDNIHDIEGFLEYFMRYEFKSLKLANFVFKKIAQKKVDLRIVLDLLASLNLKLVTSLKGKLISPLKKYLTQLEYSQFDISKSNISTLTQAFRILFYFRHEIPEFMEHLSISLIKRIQQKLDSQEFINGKQFTSLSNYVMEILSNSDLKLKTQIIESIVSITKILRKKEGLYMKVYELDFLCSHKKHIMINNDVLGQHFFEVVETLKKTDRIEHHKDLFFIMVKLHCREFVELNPFELRYFIDKCTQLVEDSMLSLSNLKQCLGYEILNCEDEFVIEKLKMYMANIIKLAFRKDKHKQNYFMYEYFLKLFSKLDSTEMVTEICSKLLNEKLYPVQISNIVPILNRNEIKNKKFISRILNIIVLSDAYVSYERMQVISWLQKIMYRIPQNDQNIRGIRFKIDLDISNKIAVLKENHKKIIQNQERSVQDGFSVEDPEFDKNYKVFIDYAWSCLKSKNVYTSEFKYICRYLYFSIDKIKARIENPIERKQISKIKLYHVFKYLRECGFFEVDSDKFSDNPREQNSIKQKLRKSRLLAKMQSHLSVMKLQKCEKLEKNLQKMEGVSFSHKAEIKSKNQKVTHIGQYLVKQSPQYNISKKNEFVILTVKSYHLTRQIEVVEMEREGEWQLQKQKRQKTEKSRSAKQKQVQKPQDQFGEDEDIDVEEQVLVEVRENVQKDEIGSHIEESELSLELKPGKIFGAEKLNSETKPAKVTKPLFGTSKKPKETQTKPMQKAITTEKNLKEHKSAEKAPTKQELFQTALKLETPSENLYKDYNGYLKVEKSLVQLVTSLKCIIYDPEKDIFFY